MSDTVEVSDTFTGSAVALRLHTADSTHRWWRSDTPSSGGDPSILTGASGMGGQVSSGYYVKDPALAQSYVLSSRAFVQCTFQMPGTSSSVFWDVMIGGATDDTTAAADGTHYAVAVHFKKSTGLLELRKCTRPQAPSAFGDTSTVIATLESAGAGNMPTSLLTTNTLRLDFDGTVTFNGTRYSGGPTLAAGMFAYAEAYDGSYNTLQTNITRMKSFTAGYTIPDPFWTNLTQASETLLG